MSGFAMVSSGASKETCNIFVTFPLKNTYMNPINAPADEHEISSRSLRNSSSCKYFMTPMNAYMIMDPGPMIKRFIYIFKALFV